MAVDLTSIKVGDKLAVRTKVSSWSKFPITHHILVVDRITASQVTCVSARNGSGQWRFRKSDGEQIGEGYFYAELATDELIAKINEQYVLSHRDSVARFALSDLEGKHLHQLHLTLEQTEALAKAWTEIKAMKVAV